MVIFGRKKQDIIYDEVVTMNDEFMNIDIEGNLKLTVAGLVGQSLAVIGIKGSGKSNTAAVLMEEYLKAGMPIVIVDVEGEYSTLKAQHPDITIIGAGIHCVVDMPLGFDNAKGVAEAAYLSGKSVVLDLSGFDDMDRETLLNLYLGTVWALAAHSRIPTAFFLEEAHHWIPQGKQTAVKKVLVNFAVMGRKRGLSLVMIGQRSAQIDKGALTQADVIFMHRVRHPTDVKVYADMLPYSLSVVKEKVNALKVGEALILVGERVLRCRIRERQTKHVGATPTLANVPAFSQMSLLDLLKQGGK